ncbi:MAG TPA: cation:dicarboxylase symporter family transporter [Pyrinomonadaceae bacterium]|nr:cation:dicarboxylase symporter family transporter [Pyrinomonadaceae bacterium]
MTRSTRNILIGLALGIATGFFVGEYAGVFKYVADAYVRLLQMTVLPYLVVSVIGGFGSLDGLKARRLFLRVGLLTVLLWLLALGLVFLMPLAFPTVQTASFFSTTLVEEVPPLDFVSLYIPTNAFQSLANNVVPAVVLFSGFLGVALIGIEQKEPLLSWLSVVEKVLGRANKFAVKLTPIGLFAIAANTVGTIDTEQLSSLRIFLIGYGGMALLLTFWILPGLVTCLTGIPARRVLQATRDALITAFITGELFVVLAILVDRSKELLEEYGQEEPEEGAPADIIIPAFYNFPHVAKLLSLSFVLFAAWSSDTIVSWATRAQLGLAGIASLFGSMNSAIPFLLDLSRVPSDTFQLFLATGVINARFGTLAAAMHMVVLALVGTYAMTGKLRFSPFRILRYGVITVVATGITLAGIFLLVRVTGQGTYNKDQVVENMQFLRPPSQRAVVLSEMPKEPAAVPSAGSPVLATVRERGRLRVGYIANSMPYCFENGNGELVGFDVEMAYTLAEELGVALDFVPVTNENIADVLDTGQCDVVMSGVIMTTNRANRMAFSSNYLDETLAFIVPDYRRADFSEASWIRKTPGLRVAVPNLAYARELVRREFPGVTIVEVPLSNTSITSYFKGESEHVDALVLTAERGSFRTLLYPAFSVAVPHPVVLKLPLAYPVARHDIEAARFLSNWIDLKTKDGTIASLYGHWILGQNAHSAKKRWSIIRNVLHWVN